MAELQDTQNGLAWMIAVLLLKEGRAPERREPGWDFPDVKLTFAGIAYSVYDWLHSYWQYDCPGEYSREKGDTNVALNQAWKLEWIDTNTMLFTLKFLNTVTYPDSYTLNPLIFRIETDRVTDILARVSTTMPTDIFNTYEASGDYRSMKMCLVGDRNSMNGGTIETYEDGVVHVYGNETTITLYTKEEFDPGRGNYSVYLRLGGRGYGGSSSMTYPAGTEIKVMISLQQVAE